MAVPVAGSPSKSRSAADSALFGGAIVLASLLRLPLLETFPRLEADEGLWTTSTKNFLLFGDWFLDGRKHVILSPLFHVLSLPFFEAIGIHILSARVLSALAGIATVALVYLIAERLGFGSLVAAVAAFLCASNEWAVVLSRKALIESVEVCFLSLSVLLALRGGTRGAVGAGIAFGLTLLTKSNALAMLPVVALTVAFASGAKGKAPDLRRGFAPVAAFVLVAALVAGVGYLPLYLTWPDSFRAIFRFVLEDKGAQLGSRLVSVGRFGLEPALIAASVIGLFRESPFLLVLASLGAIVTLVSPSPAWLLVAGWAALWTSFSFMQLFQPLRYFFLAFPALVLLASRALDAMADVAAPARRTRLLALLASAVVLFETAYVAANASHNREDRIAAVREWSRSHLTGGETVLASSFLAVDIPARVLGRYYLVGSPDSLAAAIRRNHVDYVLWDNAEWPAAYRVILDRDYPKVAEWSFGAVYRTSDAVPATTP